VKDLATVLCAVRRYAFAKSGKRCDILADDEPLGFQRDRLFADVNKVGRLHLAAHPANAEEGARTRTAPRAGFRLRGVSEISCIFTRLT
jgi:hypothetical protein